MDQKTCMVSWVRGETVVKRPESKVKWGVENERTCYQEQHASQWSSSPLLPKIRLVSNPAGGSWSTATCSSSRTFGDLLQHSLSRNIHQFLHTIRFLTSMKRTFFHFKYVNDSLLVYRYLFLWTISFDLFKFISNVDRTNHKSLKTVT